MSSSFAVLAAVLCVLGCTADDLNLKIKDAVEQAYPASYPSDYSRLVSSINSDLLFHTNKSQLTATELETWWQYALVDPQLKKDADAKVKALIYAQEELIVVTQTKMIVSDFMVTSYLILAGAHNNDNSSLFDVAMWSGGVGLVATTQTVWQQCCDETCDVGSCGSWISIGCGGCTQDRPFTTGEVMDLAQSLNTAARAKILGSASVSLSLPSSSSLQGIDVLGASVSFLSTYGESSELLTKMVNMLNLTFPLPETTDASYVVCVAQKDVNNFAQGVLPENAVTPADVQAWASLSETSVFMGVCVRSQTVTYFAVKKNASCYDFVMCEVNFPDLSIFSLNINSTQTWTAKDDQLYVFYDFSNKDTTAWASAAGLYVAYPAVKVLTSNKRASQFFHGKVIPAAMFGDYLPSSNGVFDDVVDFVEHIAEMLKTNISAMGTPMVAQATKLNTCLGFEYFNAFIDSSTVECVADENIVPFVMGVFEEVFWAYNDTEKLKEELIELEYGPNVTWVVQRIAYSSDNTTYPGYVQLYKRQDATRNCSNWVISYIDGVAKIAPDMYTQTTEKKFLWGAFSETEVNIVYEPHKVSPEDALALSLFFNALASNGVCGVVGASGLITQFPNLDC